MKENRKPKRLYTLAEMAKNLRSVTGPPIDAVDSSTSSPSSGPFLMDGNMVTIYYYHVL